MNDLVRQSLDLVKIGVAARLDRTGFMDWSNDEHTVKQLQGTFRLRATQGIRKSGSFRQTNPQREQGPSVHEMMPIICKWLDWTGE